MKVLMSIKPLFCEKILLGTKQWEYRRVAPQPYSRNALSWRHSSSPFCVLIYASAPVCRIVGEMMIDYSECGFADTLIERAKGMAGISQKELAFYLFDEESGESYGWGLHIAWVRKFSQALSLDEAKLLPLKQDIVGVRAYIKRPPQNFCYVRDYVRGMEELEECVKATNNKWKGIDADKYVCSIREGTYSEEIIKRDNSYERN